MLKQKKVVKKEVYTRNLIINLTSDSPLSRQEAIDYVWDTFRIILDEKETTVTKHDELTLGIRRKTFTYIVESDYPETDRPQY